MRAVWQAEENAGVFIAWLPLYMRADPFGAIDAEIKQDRCWIEELDAADRAPRRAEASQRLSVGRRGRPMTTSQYASLSEADRAELERAFGLDEPAELRKFGTSYDE
jgi:hypothetical protein